MSRLTEALRKAHDSASNLTSGADAEDATAVSAGFTDSPWGFTSFAARKDGGHEKPRPATTTVDKFESPYSPLASSDELVHLAQRLFDSPAAGPSLIRSVLFTGMAPEGGSATVCAGTAEALSNQTTGSVCVVDANLRSPSLSALFGITNASGLSNVLLEEEPVANCLTRIRHNLWIMPAGSRCSEAQTSLFASAFDDVLTELRTSFEYVLIDSSPNGGTSPVTAWATIADGVVLIMDAGVTRREVVRRTAEMLRTAQINILGAVLTNRTYPIPEMIYRRL